MPSMPVLVLSNPCFGMPVPVLLNYHLGCSCREFDHHPVSSTKQGAMMRQRRKPYLVVVESWQHGLHLNL